jgi:hypothetical protein
MKTNTVFKWTIITLGLCGLVYIARFLYLFYAFVVTIPGEVKDEIREKECFGTIIALTETQPCFSKMSIKQDGNSMDLTVCTCGLTKDFWNFTTIGDKIEKKKGQMKVTIIKQKNLEKKEFEYPYCLY